MDELKGQLGIRTDEELSEFRTRMRQELEAEISSCGRLRKVLFSNEHCSSRLRKKDELERIKALLSPFAKKIRVLLYIRPQWQLAASLYSTYVKTGGTKPFHFPEAAVLSSKFDYKRVVTLWRSVFGESSVVVRRFQRTALRGSDILEDLIEAAGLPGAVERIDPQNVRLCAAGTEFLRLFNSRVPRTIDFTFNELRGNIQALLECYDSGRAFVPDPKVIDRIRDWSKDINDWISQHVFSGEPAFLDDGEEPDGNWKEYRSELTQDELLEIFAFVWQEKQKQANQLKQRVNRLRSKI